MKNTTKFGFRMLWVIIVLIWTITVSVNLANELRKLDDKLTQSIEKITYIEEVFKHSE